MIPDLGNYAFEVLSAYAVSIASIVALVWASLDRAARVKKQLGERDRRV